MNKDYLILVLLLVIPLAVVWTWNTAYRKATRDVTNDFLESGVLTKVDLKRHLTGPWAQEQERIGRWW